MKPANEENREWILAKLPDGKLGIVSRKSWPIRGATYIGAYRTHYAAELASVTQSRGERD